MKVKILTSPNALLLETEVNKFIERNIIINLQFSSNSRDFSVMITYRESGSILKENLINKDVFVKDMKEMADKLIKKNENNRNNNHH